MAKANYCEDMDSRRYKHETLPQKRHQMEKQLLLEDSTANRTNSTLEFYTNMPKVKMFFNQAMP